MGRPGPHPQTGQPQPPRDVAHLHLLVSSIRVGISISQTLAAHLVKTWFSPGENFATKSQKSFKTAPEMTEMDRISKKGGAPTNTHNVLK